MESDLKTAFYTCIDLEAYEEFTLLGSVPLIRRRASLLTEGRCELHFAFETREDPSSMGSSSLALGLQRARCLCVSRPPEGSSHC